MVHSLADLPNFLVVGSCMCVSACLTSWWPAPVYVGTTLPNFLAGGLDKFLHEGRRLYAEPSGNQVDGLPVTVILYFFRADDACGSGGPTWHLG